MALDRGKKTTSKRLPASNKRSSSATNSSSTTPTNRPELSTTKRTSSSQDGVSASSASHTGSVDSLNAAVTLLTGGCRGERKLVAVHVKFAIQRIQQASLETGLNEQDLERLVDVAGCGKLNKTLSRQIIKCLIPSSTVSRSAVSKTVSWICCSTADNDTRVWLVRWLLVVYENICAADVLQCMYGPMFMMLHRLELRPYLCELLSRVTRRDNVKMFRVNMLMQMIKMHGVAQSSAGAAVSVCHTSELMSLLAVYKQYCPHLVPISLSSVKQNQYSTRRDRLWVAQMTRVITRQGPARDGFDLSINSTQAAAAVIKLNVGGAKRLKLTSAVPSVGPVFTVTLQPSHHTLALPTRCKQPIAASEIRDFESLLRNITNTELPDQIAVILRNKNLQYLFAYCNQPTSRMRLSYWLDHTLNTEFFGCNPLEHRQRELLELLCNLSDFLQEGLPACEAFLAYYLPVWNGRANRDLILHLITRWRICDFTPLKDNVLQYLHSIYVSATEYCKLDVLLCLTELLRNYCSVEWQRYRAANLTGGANVSMYLFTQSSQDIGEVDALDCMSRLISFMQDLCMLGVRAHNCSVLMLHVVLSFLELVADIYPRYSVPLLYVPSRALVYSCLLQRNASVLSRLCHIIVRFRDSYCRLRNTNYEGPNWTERERVAKKQSLSNSIPLLNEYISTMCDVVWRGKLSFLTPDTLRRLSIRSDASLSFYQHFALLSYVRVFISQTQPGGYVGRPAVIKSYRDAYLTYLSRQGLDGISSFVRTSVKRHVSASSQQLSQQSTVVPINNSVNSQ